MTQPKNVKANAQEDQIKEPIDREKSGLYKLYRWVAIALDVPPATLTHCASGRPT